MFDNKSIEEKSVELINYFWSIDNMSFKNKKLHEFYNNNSDCWITNAKKLRSDYPVETNLFLANMYRSNFSFKIATDRLQFVTKNPRYSISDKLRLLKNAFENAYHHFALITICSNYSRGYVNSLFKRWYIPDKAREREENIELNPWRNSHNDIISGKKWTLMNCPLLKFSPVQIDILQLIKNTDSHEKLVITKNEILFLDKDKPRSMKIKDFNSLFRFTYYALNLALHFNLILAIKYNFWVTPAIILTNPEKFAFKKIELPDFNNSSNGQERKRKSNSKTTKEQIENLVAIGYALLKFSFGNMWVRVMKDKDQINKFLDFYNLEFSEENFDKFHKSTLDDLLNILLKANDSIKELVLGEKTENKSNTVNYKSIKDIDLREFQNDFIKTIEKIFLSKSETIKKQFRIIFIFSMLISLVSPFYKINQSLKEIIIEKNSG